MTISFWILILCSVASADTYSPIYAKGRMSDDTSFTHCKDVGVRIRHEAIIKNSHLRVTNTRPMTLTMTDEDDGKDVVRVADEYDTGLGKWRFKSKVGWYEMQIFVWPKGGVEHEDRIYIGVMRIVNGTKCSELWSGEASRVTP